MADQRTFCYFIFLSSGFLLGKQAAEPRQTVASEAAACLFCQRLSEMKVGLWGCRGAKAGATGGSLHRALPPWSPETRWGHLGPSSEPNATWETRECGVTME